MVIRVLCVTFLLSSALVASIQGQLVSKQGKPLAGVEVRLEPGGASAVTDGEGNFVLDAAPGPYTVVVMGERIPADLREGEAVEIRIQAFGETVVVEPPGVSVERVSEEALRASPGATLPDRLALQPGVHQAGLGGAFQAVSIGGLGKHRVRMELNGYRLEGDRRAGTDLGTLMPVLASGASIFRGGTGLSHGSEAMGGVVDADLPQPGRDRPAWGVEGAYGSNDDRGQFLATLGGDEWLVAAGMEDAGRYEDGEGTVQEGTFTRYNLYSVYKRETGNSTNYLDLLFMRGEDIGKPMVTAKPTTYPENTLALAGLRGFSGPFRYQAGLIYQSLETATSDESSVIDSVNLHAKGYYDRGPWTFGLEAYTRQGMDAEVELVTGTQKPLDGASRVELSPLASWRREWASGWTIETGARYNYIYASDGREESRQDGLPTGTLKLDKRFGAHRFHAAVFNSFRFPTMEELYYDGLTAKGYVNGNPDLDPETGLGASAGWSRAFAGGSAGLAYTLQDIDDFIERYKVSSGHYGFRNLGGARVQDVTATLQWRSLSLGMTWAAGENRDTGAPVDDIPPLKASLLWQRAFGAWRPYAVALWADDFEEPGPSEAEREGYTVLSAGVAWDAAPGLTLTLRAENLLDELYTPSADAAAVPAIGRQIIVGVALRAR